MQVCASFLGQSVQARPQARRARASVKVQAAADRTLWLPGAKPPAHLNGTMPGDNGFDPLGLGTDPERLKWYAEAEKTNGRWAMAAVAGILFTDLIGKPLWFSDAQTQEYWAPANVLTAIMFPIMGFLELKRYQGWKETGTSGFLNSFPYDPLGQNSPDRAVKEVKNGRLAMVAFIGFCVQALVTREGPISNLTSHLSGPFDHNIISSVANLPNVVGK